MSVERDNALAGLRYHILGWYPLNGSVGNVHTPGTNELVMGDNYNPGDHIPGKRGLALRRLGRYDRHIVFPYTVGMPTFSFAIWCRFPDNEFQDSQFISTSALTGQRVTAVGGDLHYQANGGTTGWVDFGPTFPDFQNLRKGWNHYAWSVRFAGAPGGGWVKTWFNGQATAEQTFTGNRIPTVSFQLYQNNQIPLALTSDFDEIVVSPTPWRDIEIEALYNDGAGASYPASNRGFPLSRLVN